jgi:hypothetical protein
MASEIRPNQAAQIKPFEHTPCGKVLLGRDTLNHLMRFLPPGQMAPCLAMRQDIRQMTPTVIPNLRQALIRDLAPLLDLAAQFDFPQTFPALMRRFVDRLQKAERLEDVAEILDQIEAALLNQSIHMTAKRLAEFKQACENVGNLKNRFPDLLEILDYILGFKQSIGGMAGNDASFHINRERNKLWFSRGHFHRGLVIANFLPRYSDVILEHVYDSALSRGPIKREFLEKAKQQALHHYTLPSVIMKNLVEQGQTEDAVDYLFELKNSELVGQDFFVEASGQFIKLLVRTGQLDLAVDVARSIKNEHLIVDLIPELVQAKKSNLAVQLAQSMEGENARYDATRALCAALSRDGQHLRAYRIAYAWVDTPGYVRDTREYLLRLAHAKATPPNQLI